MDVDAAEIDEKHADRETPPSVRPEVLDAIRRLTVRQRGVVYLTYWLDLELREAAQLMHISSRIS